MRRTISFPFYFVVFYFVWALRATVFYSAVDLSISNEVTRLIFANVVKFLLWIVPAVAYIVWVDRDNPLEEMRITTKTDWNGVGLASGITILYFGCVFAFEALVNHRTLLPLLQAAPLALVNQFLAVFISPFTEEILFRGFVLSKLQESQNFWSANILQSILFAAVHLPLWIWLNGLSISLLVMSMTVFILGLLLGWITSRTNSIWTAIFVHIMNNFLVAFLG